jgi:hypothetical protein
MNYRKNMIQQHHHSKNHHQSVKHEIKRPLNLNDQNKISNNNSSKVKEVTSQPTVSNKNQSNPEFIFFESLKNIFDDSTYKILIKLLHLYNEVSFFSKNNSFF